MRLSRTFHVDDDRFDVPGRMDRQIGGGKDRLDAIRGKPFRNQRSQQTITLDNQDAAHDASVAGRALSLRVGR